jgi:hypothetical protein
MTLRNRPDLPSDVTNRITRGDAAMRRILKASALLAAVTLVAAIGAGAALSPSYQVSGNEVGGPHAGTNPFKGGAVGSAGDNGRWEASVAHQPFANCTTVDSSCAITGGTFTLRSNTGSQLNETFSDGSLQLQAADPGCGRQQFAFTASLTGDATLSFVGVLTQNRFQWHGECVVLLATVQGSVAPPPDGGGQL